MTEMTDHDSFFRESVIDNSIGYQHNERLMTE